MKPITTSVYTFRDIIEGGFLYVDKTRRLYELVKQSKGIYFLSRPRRFGKSLTLSTFESIFLGEKELFKGLYLYDQPFEWQTHPVIRIDLGDKQATSAEELKEKLSFAVRVNADRYGINLNEKSPDSQFKELIIELSQRNKVVILVDEYDKPILGNVTNPAVAEIRDVLKGFYSVIKSADSMLRFVFVTGVSKFSQSSIFSDLNNLTDLTMNSRFADMPGFTQEEVENCFSEYIDLLADKEGISREELLDRIRDWYNGYRFTEKDVRIYNPVSIGKLFDNLEFSNFWFETGTPTFLLNLLRAKQISIKDIRSSWAQDDSFSTYDVEKLEALPLFFQTGYLTIKEIRKRADLTFFRLDYPNKEVERSFTTWLASDYSAISKAEVDGALFEMLDALDAGDVDKLLNTMKIFFAKIPYTLHLGYEKYYQSIFFCIFTLLGVETEAEVTTNIGRIDAVAETHNRVYIFEFKLTGTAEEALSQIEEKRYHEKYLNSGKQLILIGAAFDPETRNIENWLVREA